MSELSKEDLIEIIKTNSKKLEITPYEFNKNTSISLYAARQLLLGKTENPSRQTLETMLNYIEKKKLSQKTENNYTEVTFIEEPNENYIPKKTKDKVVPYYNIEISGSYISSFEEAKEYIEFYIDYKPLNNCTAYLPYYGDSMYPKYNSGNTLAVKQINNLDIILWGEAHLIITNANANNYKTVKCLHQHTDENKIILRATNPKYSGDIIIDKKDILSLFLVKGKIELNEL